MRYDPSAWADGPVRGQLWTRRDGEPIREYGWFLRYLARPAHHRHPNHIAAELDRPAGPVRAAARAWRWSERARAWDATSREVTERRRVAFTETQTAIQIRRQFPRPDAFGRLLSNAAVEKGHDASARLAEAEQRLKGQR